MAKGGLTSTGTAGGVGGASAGGTGQIRYSGGNGGAGTGNVGGGGGSTGGSGGAGKNGSAGSGNVGGAGGGPATGNNGGGGAAGGNNNGNGNGNQTCVACGGGGGGGIGSTTGGTGSVGMAQITLPALLNVTVGVSQTICPGLPQPFMATGSGGNTSSYNYKWQYNNTDTTNAAAWTDLTSFLAPNTYTPTTSISTTTWYRAIITETTGCVSLRYFGSGAGICTATYCRFRIFTNHMQWQYAHPT